jgi:3-phenylpropionate/cinnamic acid dioxygenase small subunit
MFAINLGREECAAEKDFFNRVLENASLSRCRDEKSDSRANGHIAYDEWWVICGLTSIEKAWCGCRSRLRKRNCVFKNRTEVENVWRKAWKAWWQYLTPPRNVP